MSHTVLLLCTFVRFQFVVKFYKNIEKNITLILESFVCIALYKFNEKREFIRFMRIHKPFQKLPECTDDVVCFFIAANV